VDHDTAAAYLHRIGLTAGVGPPSAELLAELHARHLHAVPFENLSIHLGEPITLDEGALIDKIIRRRRGGFCYELNGLFAALLAALGFPVTRHAARVFTPVGLSPPFDHLALIVTVDEQRWLADVGFGRHSVYPLRLDTPQVQDDPDAKYAIVPAAEGDIDVLRNGEPQYRLETRPRELDEFAMGCWFNQSSPQSHFTRGLTCTLLTGDGRVTLSGNRLIRTVGDERIETELPDDEILDAYRTLFGFELDRVPALR
jgi:N-hydroxyarylamine O-acetyltransferase